MTAAQWVCMGIAAVVAYFALAIWVCKCIAFGMGSTEIDEDAIPFEELQEREYGA